MQRKKWNNDEGNLKLGDVVLAIKFNQPRGQWFLGRVHALHTAQDGIVRLVDVQTKHVICKRPATKICLLEQSDNVVEKWGARKVNNIKCTFSCS